MFGALIVSVLKCRQEQDMSYRCLHENNFDRDKCEMYFVNYNNCKEFWVSWFERW